MELPEQTYTWRGLPYFGSRPIHEAEASVIAGRLRTHSRHAWIWRAQAILCVLVVLLALLPIPLMLAGVEAAWCLGLAAILFMAAGILGGLLEVFRPVNRLRQALCSGLLVCIFGFVGRWLPGETAPLLGKVLGLIGLIGLMVGGGALSFLRCIDQWRERAFYRRLKEDQATGAVWGFGELIVLDEEGTESRSPIAEVLPRSGLVASLRGGPFPETEPVLPMAAAPRPTRTWEIPSLAPPPPGLRRAKRKLTESERMEGQAALLVMRRRWLIGAISFPILVSLLYWGVLLPRMAPTPEGRTGAYLLAITLAVTFIWLAVKGRRRLDRLAMDIQEGNVELFRPVEGDDLDLPLAELLPHSRYIWTWRGRLGPIRLSRQERGIKR